MKLKTGFRDSREARSFAQANAELEELFQGGKPETLPRLTGPITLEDGTVITPNEGVRQANISDIIRGKTYRGVI